MDVNAGGLGRNKDQSKETKKRHRKDSVLMEVNTGVLDRGYEGKKRHQKDSEDGERKKMRKDNSEAERNLDHEERINLRHGKDAKKEMSRKYDKHRHSGGQRRGKGHQGHSEDRDSHGKRKGLGRTSESWNNHQDLGRKSERWDRNQGNQGFLDRWVPTRDSDEERIQDLKNDWPSKEIGEKGEEKKLKSAWLIEGIENQHHSPVTLSDVEFSNDFDSRISGRQFKIAQDYGHLKSEGPKRRK